MQGQGRIFLFSYVVAVAIPVSLAFNIDTTNPDVDVGEQKDFFGYKVLQFKSTSKKGLIVTAPLQRDGSGGICILVKNQNATCFRQENISHNEQKLPVKHLGLSIAPDSTGSHFTVCSPSVAHECNKNSYLNSMCYNITDDLQEVSSSTPAFQECTKDTVDLVFLFDGSGSMTGDEFAKNKDFIMDIINRLKNTSIKFAAVQFSSDYRKVFDFNDYEAGTALDKLQREPHMKTLTNTHKALKFVLEDILENPHAGASSGATKVLVLITDGDPSDSDRFGIIKRYDAKNIIRFVIGVKAAKLDKFEDIASKPTDKYAFKIENYNGLTGILENFQIKIFKIEGSSGTRAGDITKEMSQSGFSAVFYDDTLVLGSVGSNNWRGSLQELRGQTETQIEDPHMQSASYMGYSIAVGQKNNAPLYFTGAPRFEHTGQVVLFTHNGNNWITAQRLNGDQIGSYFGAELCSVDINSDSTTDFLLVGAPLFYQPQEKREGQIYVYSLTDEMQLKRELNVTVASMGRFGTTISSLADLNGDGLRDVAVGAPLEDDNKGAVYIYLGDRRTGIRSTFSQRIMGQNIKPGLRFFGQAIDGDIDLGDDALPDIAIGSQGTAVVLRSRPVFNVMARLSFQPEEISIEKIDCWSKTDESVPMVNLAACFKMVETTKSKAGRRGPGLNISYILSVDHMRQTYRGFFGNDKKAKNFTSTFKLLGEETCFHYNISMPICVKDTLSPISIKLSFSQVDSEHASAVLNMDSKRQAVVEVPFEKKCAKNDTCIAELEVDFNFTTPVLLIKEDNYFNVSVKLSNHGDDSYNTSLTMYYPLGLSFSRMALTEATRPTVHYCYGKKEELDKTVCSISLPVYRSRSSATFTASFGIPLNSEYEWNDTASVTISGRSDNANTTKTSSLTKNIPVQFEIKIAITVREDSTTYLNFTEEDSEPKSMTIIYEITNLGVKAFPASVSLFFPTELEHNFEMMNYKVSVQENKTQCKVFGIKSECQTIRCDTFILEKESTTQFILSGHVQFKKLKELAKNIDFLKRYTGDGVEVKFKSFIKIDYNKTRYVLESHRQENSGSALENCHETGLWKNNDPSMKMTEVRVEFIIRPHKQLIISTGVGLGLLLLIIIAVIMFKLGCFKRKTFAEEEEEEEDALQQCTPADSTPTSDEKKPLNADESNGSTSLADTKEDLV
ncbi:integrin alpha-D [Toxotes jaculatrix]|uniref:integrin alpha-D n=1 Tax=Toxotes jaculatrix TaxID=941984 RepID=UPI001B3AEBD3|nr:integrin alpha-D [Toxotes jaculatrix]